MENGPGLKMYFLLKMVTFHWYVGLPAGSRGIKLDAHVYHSLSSSMGGFPPKKTCKLFGVASKMHDTWYSNFHGLFFFFVTLLTFIIIHYQLLQYLGPVSGIYIYKISIAWLVLYPTRPQPARPKGFTSTTETLQTWNGGKAWEKNTQLFRVFSWETVG